MVFKICGNCGRFLVLVLFLSFNNKACDQALSNPRCESLERLNCFRIEHNHSDPVAIPTVAVLMVKGLASRIWFLGLTSPSLRSRVSGKVVLFGAWVRGEIEIHRVGRRR